MTKEFSNLHVFSFESHVLGFFMSPVKWPSLPLLSVANFPTVPILGSSSHSICEELAGMNGEKNPLVSHSGSVWFTKNRAFCLRRSPGTYFLSNSHFNHEREEIILSLIPCSFSNKKQLYFCCIFFVQHL